MKKLTKMAAGFSICLMAFTTSLFGAGKKVSIPNGAERFGLLKIVSTENNGSNDFVTKPVAKHVRESQLSWGDKSNINAPEPYYEKCIISYGDREIGEAQVKVRGNWTTDYAKKSLRIKFDKKQNIGDLHSSEKYKNWVLLAVYKDPSFLRDAVALEMYNKMFKGYASECQLVELEVNGEYFGVYLLAEQQEAKRLGLTEPEKNATNTDIGYLIELDGYSYTEAENEQFNINYLGNVKDYNGKTVNNFTSGYSIKSDINDKVQHDFIADYMNKVWKICYEAVYNKKYYKFDSNFNLLEYTPAGSDNNAKCFECVSQVINIESLADFYIYNEIICDPDLYYSSFFMSVDFAEGKDHRLSFSAPWDFDSTMGNKRFSIAGSDCVNEGINAMFAGVCQPDVNGWGKDNANPWMVIFIREPWFQKIVKEEWAKIPSQKILTELQKYIDEYSSKKYQAVYDATRKVWGNPTSKQGISDELCAASKTAAAKGQAASAEYFKGWLTKRFAAVDNIIRNLQ
ncbi:MAG: CotH kinase family protein [Treponema sp.]|nr:CotH kinase family protein [Treponema sp.]